MKSKGTSESGNSKQTFTLSRRALGGWLLVFCLVSAWMFTVGVLVGRGTAPVKFDIEKFEKELAAIKTALLKKGEEQSGIATDAMIDRLVQFHEKLKSPQEEVRIISAPAAAADPESGATADEVAEPQTAAAPPVKVSQKRATFKGRTARAVSGGFAVQVASVKDAEAAANLVSGYRKQGYPVYRETATVDGQGLWYRIRIGPFPTKAEAERMHAALTKAKIKGFIIDLQP